MVVVLATPLVLQSAPPDPSVFETTTWAEAPQLKNPVSLSFDRKGRLYVVETARRGAVDVDIRSHKPWVIEDLANQSVDDLRAFVRRRFAPEHSESNRKWPADYNGDGSHDWRDLTAISDSLRVLEDTDRDGKADRSTVFADGFNEEITGVAEGVLWHNNEVFYTIFPDLWKLVDTDDDGRADQRESMFRGFGVHAAFDGHDIHGLTIGPDGMLYFSVGDNGFSVTTKEGERLHYPNQGAILRCDYDGSNLEVFAHGLRNPQEIAFDEFGNLFTVDNDGDMRGERERLVYLVEGGDSGWRTNWQFRTSGWSRYTKQPTYNPWIDERMWVPQEPGQPAHITPALANYSIGPGGFKYHPGIALNDAYRGYFFLVQFPAEVVSAFRVIPKGASFEMVDEHPFHEGLMISAVDFGNDGALYMADWEGKWMPNEKGSIRRVDDPQEQNSPRRRALKALLEGDWESKSSSHLTTLLGHADQRVRLRAQYGLAERGAGELFLGLAANRTADQLARIHALWGLRQLKGAGISDLASLLPLDDPDPEIRAQCAQLAGRIGLKEAVPKLITHLDKDHLPRVQFFAAIALGKLGDQAAYSPLVDMLYRNDGKDAFLRHAGVMGLAGLTGLEALRQHRSSEVRRAAVVALRKQRNPEIAAFLYDFDPDVLLDATRGIHDDFSIPAAMPELAAFLSRRPLKYHEGFIRRLLNANLRVGTQEAAERLLEYALSPEHPHALRHEAVLCLAHWSADPYLDRVTSRYRRLGARDPGLGRRLLEARWSDLVTSADPPLLRSLTKAANEFSLSMEVELVQRLATETKRSPGVRAEALQLLFEIDAPEHQKQEALERALRDEAAILRQAAHAVLYQHDLDQFFGLVESDFATATLAEQQAFLKLMGTTKKEDTRNQAFILACLENLLADRLPPELAADVLEAARPYREGHQVIAKHLKQHESALDPADPLAPHRVALLGGDPVAGREIVHNHVSAQCLRCHNLGSGQNQLGPDLQGVATRLSTEEILESLVYPNTKIAQGFEMISLTLKHQKNAVAGTLTEDTGQRYTIALLNGDSVTIDKAAIASEDRLSVSSMPPMAGVLTPLELRDAVAYLATLKDE